MTSQQHLKGQGNYNKTDSRDKTAMDWMFAALPSPIPWRRKWQPTPYSCLENSKVWGSLVGCHVWGRTESDTTDVTQQQQQQQQKVGLISLLNCFGLIFCRSFSSLVFPAWRSSFSICCKAGLLILNSFIFCLSVKFLISPGHAMSWVLASFCKWLFSSQLQF